MNIIVCLDDMGGMMMNNRRLSRDRLLIQNLLETVGSHRLFMSEYSASLFQNCIGADMVIDDKYLTLAQPGDYCFVEREKLSNYEDKIQNVILYKWNRRYPATTFFDLSLEHWTCCSCIDFIGHSHEKITKETYKK